MKQSQFRRLSRAKSMVSRWMLGVAVSAALCGVASAQQRIEQRGLRDANNRIGSGGFNEGAPQLDRVTSGNFSNNVITGNVTGGKQFQGFVPYSDPTSFRGRTAGGLSDQFIRSSSAAPYPGAAANNAQSSRPYYGTSNTVAPPPGYAQQPLGAAGYVPVAPRTTNPGDMRLGQGFSSQAIPLPQPGTLMLPGPVDPNSQTSSVITASPLYGVRQWNPSNTADQNFLTNGLSGRAGVYGSRGLSPADMENARQQLIDPNGANQDGTTPGNPRALNSSLSPSFDSPQNKAMSGAINSVPLGSTATTSGLGTTASASGRLQSPQQQSTQYAELQRRLQQSRETTDDKTDAGPVAGMSSRQLQPTKITTDVVTRQPGAQPTDPNGVTTPSGSPLAANAQPPRTGALPGQPVIPGAAPNASGGVPDLFGGGTAATPQALPGGIAVDAKQPLQVHSLAEGVQAPALATLLKEAETSLKAGRYNTALEQYDDAERVAPNNPLILLGRANAELGQSYYARAESHLRQAFTQDQALLMGQYDLREMLGNERLDFLARDLRGIADREQRESRPVLLLAYLAYNTGDARRAAAYLDLAEKRAAGADPIYPLLRKHWSLPASALPTEMSK